MAVGTGRDGLLRDLAALVGEAAVLAGDAPGYSADESDAAGPRGAADAVVLPGSAAEVERVVEWCYRHGVAIVPRGGGSGYAGGAVPVERRGGAGARAPRPGARVRPRAVADAGRGGGADGDRPPARARERAALPARPGRGRAVADRRQHRHQRGWPARVQVRGHRRLGDRTGGGGRARRADRGRRPDPQGRRRVRPRLAADRIRGDAGGDHRRLAAPDPRARRRRCRCSASTPTARPGARRSSACSSTGWCRRRSSSSTRARSPPPRARCRAALLGAPASRSSARPTAAPPRRGRWGPSWSRRWPKGRSRSARSRTPGEVEALWRWRDGVSLAVSARRGGKLSEDVVVPLDRLAEAIAETVEIGRRHRARGV